MWLAVAFDPTKDPRRALAGLAKAAERESSKTAAVYSLRAIAEHLGRQGAGRTHYERAVEELFRREQGAGRGSEHVRRLFLTSEQIIAICGSWEKACELAGLETVQSDSQRPPGLPVPDAIALFFARHGYLPTQKALDAFTRKSVVSLASRRGTRWHEWITRGVGRITEFPQLPSPPAYGAGEPHEWEPIDIELALPLRRRRDYSRGEVLEAVEDFVRSLDGSRPSNRRYRAFCMGRPGVPSLNVIVRHGGLTKLIADVTNPSWRDDIGPHGAADHVEPGAHV